MKKVIQGAIIFCLAGHAISNEVGSDKKGWIVGAGIGTAFMEINPIAQVGQISSNKNTSLLTVFGGYNFTDWFGLEFDVSKSDKFTDVNTASDAFFYGTSFSPKFTYYLNNKLGLYFKAGLQSIRFEKEINTDYSTYNRTWNSLAPLVGAGLQYNFVSGVNARIDYKYSNLRLRSAGRSLIVFDIFDDDIDFTLNTITLSTHFQF